MRPMAQTHRATPCVCDGAASVGHQQSSSPQPTARRCSTDRSCMHGAWGCWQVCTEWYKREWKLEFEAFGGKALWRGVTGESYRRDGAIAG